MAASVLVLLLCLQEHPLYQHQCYPAPAGPVVDCVGSGPLQLNRGLLLQDGVYCAARHPAHQLSCCPAARARTQPLLMQAAELCSAAHAVDQDGSWVWTDTLLRASAGQAQMPPHLAIPLLYCLPLPVLLQLVLPVQCCPCPLAAELLIPDTCLRLPGPAVLPFSFPLVRRGGGRCSQAVGSTAEGRQGTRPQTLPHLL
jgi:hypothetical protein